MKLKIMISFFVVIFGAATFSYFKGETLSDYAKTHRDWYEVLPETNVWGRIHNTYPDDPRGYRVKLEFDNPNPQQAVIYNLKITGNYKIKNWGIGISRYTRIRPYDNCTVNFIIFGSNKTPEFFDYNAEGILWEEANDEMPLYSMNAHSWYDEFLYTLFKIFRYTNFDEF
jgi:hypothetical protein